MADKEKIGWLEWLGAKRVPDFRKARWLGGLVGFVVVSFILFIGALVLLETVQALMGIGLEENTTQHEAIRNIGLALAAIIGLPFLVWRSIVAQKQVDVAEQGQITDRINKAVEGLGTDKTVKKHRVNANGKRVYERNAKDAPDLSKPVWDEITEPNLEVRIGALFALERISQDSDRDHIQIMEILCAYIVQNADQSHVELPTGDDPTPQEWKDWARVTPSTRARADIDVALRIIARRDASRKQIETAKEYLLDFTHANFRRLDISRRDLSGADLWLGELQGADLGFAKLQGADLGFAELQGADLARAELQGADFGFAKLHGADLGGATLQGADLEGAELQGADLRLAQFSSETNFKPAALRGAGWKSVDLSMLTLDQNIVNQSYGDSDVILPDDMDWPAHWHPKDAEPLAWNDFETAWRAWQNSIGFAYED